MPAARRRPAGAAARAVAVCAVAFMFAARVRADNYKVDFDGTPWYVHVHPCQGQDARCGRETNNFASHTLRSAAASVDVAVTSFGWTPSLGDEVSIRPSHLLEQGVVTDLKVLNTTGNSKSISFTVHEPCQFSVEIGDEDSIWPDDNSLYDFANLMIFVNPPVSSWPRQPPKVSSGSACKSSRAGRNCVVAIADGSCDPITVPSNTDLWFRGNGDPAGVPKEYLYGDGCGDTPKQILVSSGGRVFLDEDVVLYGRVLSANGLGKAGVRGRGGRSHDGDHHSGGPRQVSAAAALPLRAAYPADRQSQLQQCDPGGQRDDCGLPVGKDQTSCEDGGCCWAPVDPNPDNLPWCFHQSAAPAPSAPAPTPAPAPAGPAPAQPAPSAPPGPAGDEPAGMYGYGVISNVHMQGHKFPQAAANVVSLTDDHSEIFGIVVLDSTYRNIQLGSHGSLSFTKSFAWNSETDCINLAGPGGRVTSNFFKSNDDCMKAYQDNSVYINNVVWHQNVGRALMFSWGNLNEAEDTDGSVQFINTSIIHDKMCFQQPNQLHSDPYNEALGWQAGMVYFSTLINLQHSPSNHIGTPESPVLIQNLRVESRVGGLLLVSNGYAGLDNKAGWMGKDGCTGNVHMHIDGLDLIRVRSYAAPAVGGGCYLDSSFGNIANANCVCTSDLGCNSAQCAVNITIDNVRESQESGAPSFHDSLKTGDNAVITYNSVAGGSGAATAAAQEEEAGEDEEGTRPRQLPMVRGGATRR